MPRVSLSLGSSHRRLALRLRLALALAPLRQSDRFESEEAFVDGRAEDVEVATEVHAHHGTVSAYNLASGARFEVRLPLAGEE